MVILMIDKEYGTPIEGTTFRAYSPDDRKEYLWDVVSDDDFLKDVEWVLNEAISPPNGVSPYRWGYSIVKNERHEIAFLRAFKALVEDKKKNA